MTFLIAAAIPSEVAAQSGETSHQADSAAEIAGLINDLGSASYQTRSSATRKLRSIGVAARRRLQEAAAGDDFETSLRAKQLLVDQDRLLLAGVEVSLAFSESKVPWDQSVDLLVTFQNRSEFPAKLPFEAALSSDEGQEAGSDAEQVGRMLDVADWLHVKGPHGQDVELRVDEISADEKVVAAVQRRLNSPMPSEIEPGRRLTVKVASFNRGWARYPFLEQGDYTVAFDYVPQWDDDELMAAHVGRVTSAAASITVTRAAPAQVSRAGLPSSISLEHAGNSLIASITNASDRAVVVNRNFGIAPPFAQGFWVHQFGDAIHRIAVPSKPGASWDDFDPSLLTVVPPGDSIVVARTEVADLRKKLTESGADLVKAAGTLQFSYANLCDRQWQARQGNTLLNNPNAPPALRNPLPRHVLATHQQSNLLPSESLRVPASP